MAWLELPWRSIEEGLIGLLVCHHFFACSQLEPFSERIYAFKYILVLLLLLSPITERNVREMNDAQELVVRTRGTSPQLHACKGERAKRRRPNLCLYGWSLLVIGLEIKQAQAFNN